MGPTYRYGIDGSETTTVTETGGFESRAPIGANLNSQAPRTVRSKSNKYSRGKSQSNQNETGTSNFTANFSRLLGDEMNSGFNSSNGGSYQSDADDYGVTGIPLKNQATIDNFLLENYQQAAS